MKIAVISAIIFAIVSLNYPQACAQVRTERRTDTPDLPAVKQIRETGNVGVGTLNPPAKFSILGSYGNPAIPGYSSTGILRIGSSLINEGIDIGKMGYPNYTGWIQAGFDSEIADPLSLQPLGGSVGVGTSTPDLSALVDLSSSTMGLLIPRMTKTQRDAIDSPATGLMIYQTDNTPGFYYYSGTSWVSLTGSGPGGNSPSTCIDYDGNAYPTFTIGTQTWMAENLRVTHYRNGDAIPNVTDATEWAALSTGAYCWYDNNQATNAKYGALYNWYTVNDSRGLCPQGWHAPTDAEWTTLTTYLGGESVAGGKMKSVSALWTSPNADATNISGFSGLPGGYRLNDGIFFNDGYFGFWWTSSEYGYDYAWFRYLSFSTPEVTRSYYYKEYGFSVRCLRDY